MTTHVARVTANRNRPVKTRSLLVTLLLFPALAASVHAEELFTPPFLFFDVGQNPSAVAIADLNADGRADLAVADNGCYGCRPPYPDVPGVSTLLGNGDGTFGPYTQFASGHPWSVAIADLNADGRPDLVTADPVSSTVSVLLGNGHGFGPKTDFGTSDRPYSVAIADVNEDGRPDLVAATYGLYELGQAGAVSVLLGNGNGTFKPKTDFAAEYGSKSVAIADLNADGHLDLAVANVLSNTVTVLLGNGHGEFTYNTLLTLGSAPNSVAIGDLNADGRPDLAVANTGSNTVSVLLGNGDGTFGNRTDFGTYISPYSVAIGDLNADARPDLAVANYGVIGYDGLVSVLPGNGDGTFEPKLDFYTGYPQSPALYSVAIGDLNADGRPELAVAGSMAVVVMLNTGTGVLAVGGSSIGLSLSGSVPNPSRELRVSFTLPDGKPARLVVYDVSGREVDRMAVGALGAGRHMVTLGASGAVAPGIYLVHLIRGDRRLVARMAVVR